MTRAQWDLMMAYWKLSEKDKAKVDKAMRVRLQAKKKAQTK